MPRFVAGATALLAVALVGVAGCSRGSDAHASVSAAELQKAIIAKLAQAGTPSTWVNCPEDLAGEVGATTRCDVMFSSDNSVTALLTTTQVEGDRVDWEITGPELTKDQVTRRVAGLTSAQEASCDSGLAGRPGTWVQCQTTRNGLTIGQTVEVKDAKGLYLDLLLTPMIPKSQVEEMLLARLTVANGVRPTSAECLGNLSGTNGSRVECVVTLPGGNRDTYLLTVNSGSNSSINFEYAPAAQRGVDLNNDGIPGNANPAGAGDGGK